MIRFGEIAREEYQSKHTKKLKACGLRVADIPGDFENLVVTVTLPDKTTDNDPIESLGDCDIVTVAAGRNGVDPTDGIDDFTEIETLPGAIVVRLSAILGRRLGVSDAGQSFDVKVPVLSLGGTQFVAAAAR